MAVLGASSLQIDSATLGSQTGSAPMFACRAWVNFNGTTSPGTIRGNGNVSSVTRNNQGDYTATFTTAMPAAIYAVTCGGQDGRTNSRYLKINSATSSTTQVGLFCGGAGSSIDPTIACISVFV